MHKTCDCIPHTRTIRELPLRATATENGHALPFTISTQDKSFCYIYEICEYNPRGILLTSASKNNLLYTAREFDFDTGLQLNRMRYYNSSLGRFIQKDHISNIIYFKYAFNNPSNIYDPFGEYGFWIAIMGVTCCSGLFPNPDQAFQKYCDNCQRCCERMIKPTEPTIDCYRYCTEAGCCGQS